MQRALTCRLSSLDSGNLLASWELGNFAPRAILVTFLSHTLLCFTGKIIGVFNPLSADVMMSLECQGSSVSLSL